MNCSGIFAYAAVLQGDACVEFDLQDARSRVVADGAKFAGVDGFHFHGAVPLLSRIEESPEKALVPGVAVDAIACGAFAVAQGDDDLIGIDLQSVTLSQAYAQRYQVTIKLEQVASDAVVLADEHRLMQVMSNLLSNAAKHSHANGVVTITCTIAAGQVRVSVKDQGKGIPDDFRDQVFQRFSQAKASPTKNVGTGLGLAISKSIIEHMGGSIGFDSVAGEGATFYFDLAQVNEHQPAAPSAA